MPTFGLAGAAGSVGVWRRRGGGADVAVGVLGRVVRLVPVDRADRRQAMLGELEQYQAFAPRRFASGCIVATFRLPRRHGSARWVTPAVLVAAMASAGLVGCLSHPSYPMSHPDAPPRRGGA